MSNKNTDMKNTPVNKLMITTGLPMIISMMLQALYNIVDSAFLSNMKTGGEQALNAVTLAFPIQLLMVAISVGTGIGVNALAAKSLGSQNREKASLSAGNAVFASLVVYVIFLLFGLFGTRAYISSQSENSVIIEMGCSYLSICCIFSFGSILFSVYEKLLQSTGFSLYSTIAQIAGALCNIILDPVFIYGIGFVPEMGAKGAAVATVLGQILSFVLAAIFHFRFNKSFDNNKKYIKPNFQILKEIYSIGFPAIISQALMSIMTYGLNIIMVAKSENLVTSYGLYYKIQQFVLFAAFGLRDAITPIISFAYGMGDKKRITDGIKYGHIFTFIIMLIGTIILEVFAIPLTGLFKLSGETEALTVNAARIISISFIFAGACIAFQGIFQALGSGLESLIVSLCRQIIFVLPVAYLLLSIAKNPENYYIVWFTFIISEFLSCVVSALLMKRVYNRKVKC